MTIARRILLVIAAVIVAGLIITGIVFATFHNSLFKGPNETSSKSTNAPAQSSADNSPVDGSSDSSGTSAANQTGSNASSSSNAQGSGSSSSTSTSTQTIPSTGPSNPATVILTVAVLGSAAYIGTRLLRRSLNS